jgi:hypothetical protein
MKGDFVKLKQSIQFNAGMVTDDKPDERTEYDCYCFGIALGKDHTATLSVPKEAVRANPELFKQL